MDINTLIKANKKWEYDQKKRKQESNQISARTYTPQQQAQRSKRFAQNNPDSPNYVSGASAVGKTTISTPGTVKPKNPITPEQRDTFINNIKMPEYNSGKQIPDNAVIKANPILIQNPYSMDNMFKNGQSQVVAPNTKFTANRGEPLYKYITAPFESASYGAYKESSDLVSAVDKMTSGSDFLEKRTKIYKFLDENPDLYNKYFKNQKSGLGAYVTKTSKQQADNLTAFINDIRVPNEIKSLGDDVIAHSLENYRIQRENNQRLKNMDEKYKNLNQAYYENAKMVGENVGRMAMDTMISNSVGGILGSVTGKFANKATKIFELNKATKTAKKIVKTLTPTGTTALMGITAASNKIDENLSNGVPVDLAVKNGLVNGYMQAITEKIGFEGIPGVSKVIDNVASGSFKKTLARTLMSYGVSSFGEGAEEVLQNILGGLIDKAMINPNISFKDIMNPKTNFEAFAGGALVGGVLGAIGLTRSLSAIKTTTDNVKIKISYLNAVNETLADEYRMKNLPINSSIDKVNEYSEKLKENAVKQAEAVTMTEKTPIESAILKSQNGDILTPKEVNDIILSDKGKKAFYDATGIQLGDNVNENRAIVNSYIKEQQNKVAEQAKFEPQSIETDLTSNNTVETENAPQGKLEFVQGSKGTNGYKYSSENSDYLKSQVTNYANQLEEVSIQNNDAEALNEARKLKRTAKMIEENKSILDKLSEKFDVNILASGKAQFIPAKNGKKAQLFLSGNYTIPHEVAHAVTNYFVEKNSKEYNGLFKKVVDSTIFKDYVADEQFIESFRTAVTAALSEKGLSEQEIAEETQRLMQGRSVDEFKEILRVAYSEFNKNEIKSDAELEKIVNDELFSYAMQSIADADADTLNRMFADDKTALQKFLQFMRDFWNDIVKSFKGESQTDIQYEKEARKMANKFNELYNEMIKGDNITNSNNEGVRFLLIGTTSDGIEVYETSEETKKLSYKDRKKKYLDLMENEYKGRTAKFERNGHTYYAEFDRDNLSKPIYGEKHNSKKGYKALINTGADGEIFNLVENSKYVDSEIDTKNHKVKDGFTDYFDYFVKTVQIDGKVFDLNASVKKQTNNDGGYTYTLFLTDNNKIKAAPPIGNKISVKSGAHRFDITVSQPDTFVNTYSMQNEKNNAENSKNSGTRGNLQEFSVDDKGYREQENRNRANTKRELYSQFQVPIKNRTELNGQMKSIFETIEKGKDVSETTKKHLFKLLTEYSEVVDDEWAKQNKDFIDYFRGKTFKVSNSIVSEFDNWKSLFGQVAGKFKVSATSGEGIDAIYQEALDLFPDVLDEDIWNSSDQLREIISALNSMKPTKTDIISSAKNVGGSEEDFIKILNEILEEYRVKNDILKINSGKYISSKELKWLTDNYKSDVERILDIKLQGSDVVKTIQNKIQEEQNEKFENSMDRIIGESRREKTLSNDDDYISMLEEEAGDTEVDLTETEKFLINTLRNINTLDYNTDITRVLDKMAGVSKKAREFLYRLIEKPMYAAKDKWTRNLKTKVSEYGKVMKGFGIKIGSKESKAVQWYGEGVKEDGSEYTLEDLKKDFPTKWQNIVEADKYNRQIYDNYVKEVNDTLTDVYPYVEELVEKKESQIQEITDFISDKDKKIRDKGLKAIEALKKDIDTLKTNKRLTPRKDYYRHFNELSQGIKGLIENIQNVTDIDPKLVGVSEETKPLSKWWSALQHRNGKGEYTADAYASMMDYIYSAETKIAFDPIIANLRKITRTFANERTNGEFNNSIKWLQEYTNSLAGKTNFIDRPIQALIGRNAYTKTLDFLNGRTKSNALGLNVRSAIVQFANIPNATGYIKNPLNWAKGMIDYTTDFLGGLVGIKHNSEIENSVFLRERYLDSFLDKYKDPMTVLKTPKKLANFMLEFGDREASKLIWYSAFEQGKKMKSVKNPYEYADNITRKSVGGRGIGEVPIMQQAKLTKFLAPFQVETTNQFNLWREKFKEKDLLGMLMMVVSGTIMAEIYKYIFGDSPTFDYYGTYKDIAKIFKEDGSFTTKIGNSIGRIGGEIVSNMPFGSLIAQTVVPDEEEREKIFGSADPTRFGTGTIGAKALYDSAKGLYNVSTKAINGELTAEGFVDDIMPLLGNYIMPIGGKQLQRSYKGYKDIKKEGAYTSKGNLKYPVTTKDDKFRTALFGSSTTDDGKKYSENPVAFSDKNTQIYDYITQNYKTSKQTTYETIKELSNYRKFLGKSNLSKKDVEEYFNRTKFAPKIKEEFINLYSNDEYYKNKILGVGIKSKSEKKYEKKEKEKQNEKLRDDYFKQKK